VRPGARGVVSLVARDRLVANSDGVAVQPLSPAELSDALAWRRTEPAADDALLLMRARYFGGGGVTLVDVLDALDQTVAARIAVVRALLDERVAAATVDQLLGRVEP